MNEKLFQFIWQFQYYNWQQLTTEQHDNIKVLHPGHYNRHQGPDFLNGKILIENTTWVGSIELHLRTSDWDAHRHTGDPNYRNVILHVVWEHDVAMKLPIPVLSLQHRVAMSMLDRYRLMMQQPSFIACSPFLKNLPSLLVTNWKDRLLAERLQQRAERIYQLHQLCNGHWEEVLWRLLLRNFGQKVNCDAFEQIAENLPYNLICRYQNQIQQLEALLLGQAGLLNKEFNDAYPKMLQKEFLYLSKKHQLKPIQIPVYFLRMRPANFPTVRLAQLAALIHRQPRIVSRLKAAQSLTDLQSLLDVVANDFWHYHYRLDEKTNYFEKRLGNSMINNILLNTLLPFLFAYGKMMKETALQQRALQWMQELPPEDYTVIKQFKQQGISAQSAGDTQALLTCKQYYCDAKRCLDCVIGTYILNPGTT